MSPSRERAGKRNAKNQGEVIGALCLGGKKYFWGIRKGTATFPSKLFGAFFEVSFPRKKV